MMTLLKVILVAVILVLIAVAALSIKLFFNRKPELSGGCCKTEPVLANDTKHGCGSGGCGCGS